MSDITCPHCKKVQSDLHNGGDPRAWWSSVYMPDGECEDTCDGCGFPITVSVSWTPRFTVICNACGEEDQCYCNEEDLT